MIRLILVIALTLSTLGLSGCFNSSPDEQTVPWSRPADWERGAPGFGG
ncbi:MAG: hypothetical protein R6U56_03245 [Opitutales bacterium]